MEILNHFNITVINDNQTYQIIYSKENYKGSCTYKELTPLSKKQSGKIYVLTDSNMGDVLEYIHKLSPLSEKDFNNIQMSIREHSLSNLKSHLLQLNDDATID